MQFQEWYIIILWQWLFYQDWQNRKYAILPALGKRKPILRVKKTNLLTDMLFKELTIISKANLVYFFFLFWCYVIDFIRLYNVLSNLYAMRFLTLFFSSPGPKGQVSFCHHLGSVVRRLSSSSSSSDVVSFYKKSSPLKPLGQI